MIANDCQFQKLCESIFALGSGIRFVGVIDKYTARNRLQLR
jgi:hypothetical protein